MGLSSVQNTGLITAAAATLSPSLVSATTAGNILIMVVIAANVSTVAPVVTTRPGWMCATQSFSANATAAIWYKPNIAAAETMPVFTSAGAARMTGDLLEYRGASGQVDQTGIKSGTASPSTVACTSPDVLGPDGLVVVCSVWALSAAGTCTITDTAGFTSINDQANAALSTHADFAAALLSAGGVSADGDVQTLTGATVTQFAQAIVTFASDMRLASVAAAAMT